MVDAIRRGAWDELQTLLDDHLQRFLADVDLPEVLVLGEDDRVQ
jgi:uncharacterized protein